MLVFFSVSTLVFSKLDVVVLNCLNGAKTVSEVELGNRTPLNFRIIYTIKL
jgi:hypothetical protein